MSTVLSLVVGSCTSSTCFAPAFLNKPRAPASTMAIFSARHKLHFLLVLLYAAAFLWIFFLLLSPYMLPFHPHPRTILPNVAQRTHKRLYHNRTPFNGSTFANSMCLTNELSVHETDSNTFASNDVHFHQTIWWVLRAKEARLEHREKTQWRWQTEHENSGIELSFFVSTRRPL